MPSERRPESAAVLTLYYITANPDLLLNLPVKDPLPCCGYPGREQSEGKEVYPAEGVVWPREGGGEN